jgi:hypothetical protein
MATWKIIDVDDDVRLELLHFLDKHLLEEKIEFHTIGSLHSESSPEIKRLHSLLPGQAFLANPNRRFLCEQLDKLDVASIAAEEILALVDKKAIIRILPNRHLDDGNLWKLLYIDTAIFWFVTLFVFEQLALHKLLEGNAHNENVNKARKQKP